MSMRQSLAARGVTTAVLLVGGLWVVMTVVSLAFERSTGAAVPSCLFKRLTGRPCPTCGSTRAAHALLRGDLSGAIAWNPLIVLLGMLVVAAGVWAILRCAAGPRAATPAQLGWLDRHPNLLAVVLLVAVAANWIYVLWHGN